MLRMRRASPHGKWIENNAEKRSFGRKKADSFRPDTASRDAPRFGNAFRRFSVRRPVSGLASSGAISSVPTPGRLPSHSLTREQWRLERPALTYRCGGSAGMAGALTPGAPASRFTRRAWNSAPDTCELDYSHTGGGAARLADLL